MQIANIREKGLIEVSKLQYSLLSVMLTLIIGWLCLTPDPGNLAKRVNDKTAHLLAFCVLGVFYSLALARSGALKGLVFSFLIAVAYGGLIELLQANLIVGRYGDFYDWYADSLGAFVGVLIATFLIKTKKTFIFK